MYIRITTINTLVNLGRASVIEIDDDDNVTNHLSLFFCCVFVKKKMHPLMCSKKICLVQLSFIRDSSDGTIFAKRVRICGFPLPIDNPSTAYVKEVNYPYPQQMRRTHQQTSIRNSPLQFANLSFPRIDLDLATSLEKFEYIIASNQESAEFISYFVKPSAVVINIENSVQQNYSNNETPDNDTNDQINGHTACEDPHNPTDNRGGSNTSNFSTTFGFVPTSAAIHQSPMPPQQQQHSTNYGGQNIKNPHIQSYISSTYVQ